MRNLSVRPPLEPVDLAANNLCGFFVPRLFADVVQALRRPVWLTPHPDSSRSNTRINVSGTRGGGESNR